MSALLKFKSNIWSVVGCVLILSLIIMGYYVSRFLSEARGMFDEVRGEKRCFLSELARYNSPDMHFFASLVNKTCDNALFVTSVYLIYVDLAPVAIEGSQSSGFNVFSQEADGPNSIPPVVTWINVNHVKITSVRGNLMPKEIEKLPGLSVQYQRN